MFLTEKQKYLSTHGFEATSLKAVLFDMDGVLFNSMPNHARAWYQSMKPFGLDISPEEAYLHEGRTGGDTINILAQRSWGREATEVEQQEIYKAKSELFASLPQAEPMPGVLQLLTKVKKDGFEVMVVTGSGQHTLLDKLNRSFPGVFSPEFMVTSFDVKHGKPDPEPYVIALKKAGINPWQALVVENAPLGINSSVAAKIFTIAVNTGPLPDKVLKEAGADLLFPSMLSLCECWSKVRDTFI